MNLLDLEYQLALTPEIRAYSETKEIPSILHNLVRDLTKKKVEPDEIVALSPYKPENDRIGLKSFLEEHKELYTTNMTGSENGKIRVGTIQAFKGLEADVIILCGIDNHLPACNPANLYVGATRARSMLYVVKIRASGQ